MATLETLFDAVEALDHRGDPFVVDLKRAFGLVRKLASGTHTVVAPVGQPGSDKTVAYSTVEPIPDSSVAQDTGGIPQE